MERYTHLARLLGLPPSIVRCISWQIPPPQALCFDAPTGWYVFPPALIPLWSNGSSPYYIGYWRHWFVRREPCFVLMYVEAHCASQIARTPEQLYCYLAMESITTEDGISKDLERFAHEVGLADLEELDRVTLVSGDDPRGFRQLRPFVERTPLESVASLDEYTGDFPTGDFSGTRAWWRASCSWEIPDEVFVRWPDGKERPPWLRAGRDNKAVFAALLRDGDLAGAWLTLNSTGWRMSDARQAVGDLRLAAHDVAFDLLAETWLAVADESAGGY
jgi:hypothetical protein